MLRPEVDPNDLRVLLLAMILGVEGNFMIEGTLVKALDNWVGLDAFTYDAFRMCATEEAANKWLQELNRRHPPEMYNVRGS